MLPALALAAFVLALVPTIVFLRNISVYLPPRGGALPGGDSPTAKVSVLIPARNEVQSIAAAVESVLSSEGVEVELIVLDDHSTDATADIVRRIAVNDSRLQLAAAPPLPPAWCGKQHACYTLARLSQHPLLLFLDADVRVEPRGIARAIAFMESSKADLVSGVPLQETGTFLEKLLIPLIHFVLLGFLPVRRMRRRPNPSYGAGCGQFFLARREPYLAIGGHSIVRGSLHDGLKLPRGFRAAGFRTDLFDATDVARCRMYRSAAEVWNGLAKNAVEGLGAPAMIVPSTAILGGGQVLPFLLLPIACWTDDWFSAWVCAGSIFAVYFVRAIAAVRFSQSWTGAVLHPLAVGLFLVLQWYALIRWILGSPATWKERAYLRPDQERLESVA
jgi:hypothetical protein